jgi:hypothetical protein
MSEEPTLDKLVLTYRKIRDIKYEKEAAHKEEIAELNSQLDTISAKFLDLFNVQNVESLRTEAGTVIRRAVTRYWTSDWGSMYDFIKENDAPFLLEQRIHSGNMRQFLEENPDALPVGLNTDTRYAITVRKPSTKTK